MAMRSCALVGVVLLLCASLSCASRFLQDRENHADERQLSGKGMPWNLDGVSSGDGSAGVGMAAERRNAVVDSSMGFGMGSGEGDGSGPASGIADHGVSAGEGYEHGQGYGSDPEVGAGYGGGQGYGSGSSSGQGYGLGEGSGSGSGSASGGREGYGIGEGSSSGPYGCGGQGMGEGFGQGGVPCFSDPSWGLGAGGTGGGEGGAGGSSYMPGGGGYPRAGCCRCGMTNFPVQFLGGPCPGITDDNPRAHD